MSQRTESLIYLRRASETLGPFSFEEVREQLRNGALRPNDVAAWAGSTGWLPLRDLHSEFKAMPQVARPQIPVHPLSALLLMAVDALWAIPEVLLSISVAGLPALILTSLASFGVTAFAVSRVKAALAGDEAKDANAKGIGLGVLAGLPYPIFGTAVGTCFLAWSGLRKLRS